MSIEYLNAAFETKVGNISQKFVLVCLADYADENGYCYPTLSTLAWKTGLTRRGVINCVDALIKKEFITKCDNKYIPSIYLKKANQNCYHLEIIAIRLVNVVHQTKTSSSERYSPVLVNGIHQTYNSNNHQDNHHRDIDIPFVAISKKDLEKKKLRTIPEDFALSDVVIEWGKAKGYTKAVLQKHMEYFIDVSVAKQYKYADWNAAFRNAVKSNWAKLPENGLDNDIGF
jgi:hypothetical protein